MIMEQRTIRQKVEHFLYNEYKDWIEAIHWHNRYVEITLTQAKAKEVAALLHLLFCIRYVAINVRSSYTNIMYTHYFVQNYYCGLNAAFFMFCIRYMEDDLPTAELVRQYFDKIGRYLSRA